MTMDLLQTALFVRQTKKLHKNQKTDLDNDVSEILRNLELAEVKKGDVDGIRVHKFKMGNQLTLLAYEYNESYLILLAIGSHT